MLKLTSYLKLVILTAFLQALAASPVLSGAPLKINFQGRLDENGQPAEGSKTLIFKVYDAVSGGTLVWTSAAQALALSNGIFSAILETGTPAALSTATFAGARYVEMSVDGVTLSPRQEMVSAPYALVAQALAADAELPASSIADGSVTDAKVSLTTAAITSGRFGDDRVLITTGAFSGGFNGGSQLVQLQAGGALPGLNGAALTGISVSAADITGTITDASVALTTSAVVYGKFSDDRVWITTGAVYLGLFGDDRVNISTGAITAGVFSDERIRISTGAFYASFNGPYQLVQLDATGRFPATFVADGVLSVDVVASSIAVNRVHTAAIMDGAVTDAKAVLSTAAITSGWFGDRFVRITTNAVAMGQFTDDKVSITTGAFAGGFNGPDQLVKLDVAGKLPLLDGSALTNVNSAQFDTVAADTSTIAGNLAAEIASRGSADTALSARLDEVATDTDTLAGSLSSYAGLASTQTLTGSNTFASTAAFTAQHASLPGVTVSSGLVVAGGYVGIGTASPNSMLSVAGSVSVAIKTITYADSPYVPTAADSTILIDGADGPGGPTTINLPDASGMPGRIYTFKRVDANPGGGYDYTVDIFPFGGQTIEGAIGRSFDIQWQMLTLQSYGTGWIILYSN